MQGIRGEQAGLLNGLRAKAGMKLFVVLDACVLIIITLMPLFCENSLVDAKLGFHSAPPSFSNRSRRPVFGKNSSDIFVNFWSASTVNVSAICMRVIRFFSLRLA